MLLALAETLPRELQGVSALCNPMPPFLKQNLITVHRMLLSVSWKPDLKFMFKKLLSRLNKSKESDPQSGGCAGILLVGVLWFIILSVTKFISQLKVMADLRLFFFLGKVNSISPSIFKTNVMDS